jgi:hypothetical protein
MNQDDILIIISFTTTSLLLISEILGLSKCEANSIVQLYKMFNFGGCIGKERQQTPNR